MSHLGYLHNYLKIVILFIQGIIQPRNIHIYFTRLPRAPL